MAEFRYSAVNAQNKAIQGVFNAKSMGAAKKIVESTCKRHNLRLLKIEKRTTYLYKIKKGTEKPVTGEQKAFSEDEVIAVVQKMGYKVLKINKKLLDFKMPPPPQDIVNFIRICSDLLREKLPYDEILVLVMNDMENKTLKETLKEINQDLKDGKEGNEVYLKHQGVLGKFPAYMLGVASTSGDMISIYECTAKFMERNQEFKKSLKQALLMPLFIMAALIACVFYYIGWIFPGTASLFEKLGKPLPPMTQTTMNVSDYLQSNIGYFLLIFAAIIGGIVTFVKSEKGKLFIDQYLPKIPIIGSLLHKMSIEIFARVFNALYVGSGDNITVLRVASEACRNTYMEKQIKTIAIPRMIKEGLGLIEALEATGVFTINALSRLRSGAETGTLKKTALQLANYYEKETGYKMKTVIDLIQMIITMAIMFVMIGITVISSETMVIK